MSRLSEKAQRLVIASEKARTLLSEACKPTADGVILRNRTKAGLSIRANNIEFVTVHNAESQASWQAAVNDLCEAGLIDPTDHSGVFEVTAAGYDMAEKL